MQAGAMGLPSIVTNINGCNEIVTEAENGLIIPVRDVKGLFTAMKKLATDNNLREKLQKNSRKSIVEKYERKQMWEEILKEYKHLESQLNQNNLCVE